MSDLEVAAKPIILGLIRLERGLLSLSASESLTLAGWALKTACVLTSTTLVQRPLDPAFLAEMRNGTQGFPSGVAALAMQMSTSLKFNFLEKIDWPVFLPEQNMPVPEEIENALKVSFQVGGLFFVIACPPANAKLALAAGVHVPLWPERIFLSYKARLGLTPDNPLTLLEKFSDSLGLLLEPSGQAEKLE